MIQADNFALPRAAGYNGVSNGVAVARCLMSQAEPLAVHDLVLDRYRVSQKIAVGGHGLVFRAVDERLSRPVCVKVFHRAADSDGVYRTKHEHFVQEAFALSKLTHPNTIRIYDFGYLPAAGGEQGAPFQVTEYMNGGTLSQWIRRDGPPARAAARSMLVALCGALAEAHAGGITHRDIKPQNILFLNSGDTRTVKLADFGFAKFDPTGGEDLPFHAGDTAVVAGEQIVMLSPSWAAPEQIEGDPVGPYTDIYSLALIAAYVLTGRVMLSCRDFEQALPLRVDSDSRVEETFRDHEVARDVVDLIKRACSFAPADRPQTIQELADGLGSALDKSPAPRGMALRALPEPARVQSPGMRVSVLDAPRSIGDRAPFFVPMSRDGAAIDAGGIRAKLSFVRAHQRFLVHLKGLSSFVAKEGERPSSAVQTDQTVFIDFVLPNREAVARAKLIFGRIVDGQHQFEVGGLRVSLSLAECIEAIALDFGPGAGCYFAYTPRPGQEQDTRGARGTPRKR